MSATTRRATALASVCAAALVGCGGGTVPATGGGADEPVAEPPGDAEGLRRDLEATVLENYALLELGNIDAFADRVASDRPIVLFGVEPDDVAAGVSPSTLLEDRRLFAGRGARVLSRNLDIHMSSDRSVGWVFDEVSYRVPYRGREASIPLRVTSVYTRDIDRWVLAMQHMSYALPIDDIAKAARAGELAAPGRFQTGYRVEGPATDLRRIAWRVMAGAIGPHYRDRRMADSADALLLHPGPAQEFSGSRVRGAPTLAELFGDGAGNPAEIELGDHRIEVARSGEVAWMGANLGVFPPGAGEGGRSVDLRATFVFAKRPAVGWSLVQTHVSAAAEGELVAERVFGTRELD